MLCCNKIVSHMKCEINLGIFINCESCPGGQLPMWEKSVIFPSSIKCTLLFCFSFTECIAIITRPRTAGKLTVIINCEARVFMCKSKAILNPVIIYSIYWKHLKNLPCLLCTFFSNITKSYNTATYKSF